MATRTPIKKTTTPGTAKRRAETVKRQGRNRSVKLGNTRKDPYASINKLYKNIKKLES